jgi:acyl-CoA reductase-like NAD-dependent aldehyde dehydrogenase
MVGGMMARGVARFAACLEEMAAKPDETPADVRAAAMVAAAEMIREMASDMDAMLAERMGMPASDASHDSRH